MRTSVYIAVSLDGFIARLDGEIDCGEESGEDYGYKAFLDTVDAIVMGRNTYEKALTFGEWPYGIKPVVVLSRRPLRIHQMSWHVGCRSAEWNASTLMGATPSGASSMRACFRDLSLCGFRR